MTRITQPIPVIEGVDRARFENEIFPAGKPVIMKGLVADWPAVKAAQTSNRAVADYISAMDTTGQMVGISVLSATKQGRFFYNDDLTGYNFMGDRNRVSNLLAWLLENGDREDMVTLYAQAIPLTPLMPAFERANPMDLVSPTYGAKMWVGNKVRTQTHFDPSHNIACLVAGKRRFTLFPPEQIDNLYPGPFDFAPGNIPVSMAAIEEPDFERYPRLEEALKHAKHGDLEPGDAIFIPYAWWHHVQSQTGFNVLVNYWWNTDMTDWVSPVGALYAAILAMRDLPPAEKQFWQKVMQRYVFDDPEPAAAHLPESGRYAFGKTTKALRDRLRGLIKTTLRL